MIDELFEKMIADRSERGEKRRKKKELEDELGRSIASIEEGESELEKQRSRARYEALRNLTK
jgi:hypothetical protein